MMRTFLSVCYSAIGLGLLLTSTGCSSTLAQPFQPELGDRRFWAVHPSRSAPRAPNCADCKYKLVLKNRPQFWFCNHPTTPVDAVTGDPGMVCESARGSAPHKLCGVAGRLFEPLDQPEA